MELNIADTASKNWKKKTSLLMYEALFASLKSIIDIFVLKEMPLPAFYNNILNKISNIKKLSLQNLVSLRLCC